MKSEIYKCADCNNAREIFLNELPDTLHIICCRPGTVASGIMHSVYKRQWSAPSIGRGDSGGTPAR